MLLAQCVPVPCAVCRVFVGLSAKDDAQRGHQAAGKFLHGQSIICTCLQCLWPLHACTGIGQEAPGHVNRRHAQGGGMLEQAQGHPVRCMAVQVALQPQLSRATVVPPCPSGHIRGCPSLCLPSDVCRHVSPFRKASFERTRSSVVLLWLRISLPSALCITQVYPSKY